MIEIEKILIDITDDRGHIRSVDDVEREVIEIALKQYKNATEVARRLKIGRTTLYRKLNKYNLRTAE